MCMKVGEHIFSTATIADGEVPLQYQPSGVQNVEETSKTIIVPYQLRRINEIRDSWV